MDLDPLTVMNELIRIDSTSGSPGELEVLNAVAAVFEPSQGSRIRWATNPEGRPKGLIVLPAVSDGRELLAFACHADVVPVGDPRQWTNPPFLPVERGERVYGRGSSDMKSGLAAAVAAVRALHGAGAPVALMVSTGEEVGCIGAPAIVRDLDLASLGAVIIPESTGNEISLGHRGALWLTVTTCGVAAHGSTPDRGVNAILRMTQVLRRVGDLPGRSHPELGDETVNVGVISGGAVPNIVPDTCRVSVDHRIVDPDVDPILEWWRSQPEVTDVAVDLQLAPVWTQAGDPWVESLAAPRSGSPVSYYTDASVLTVQETFHAPVVIWGPGDPAAVHSVDESVDVAAVVTAAHAFAEAGRDWAARQNG